MKRRDVIKKLAYAVPAGMAFPSIKTACDQNNITPTPVYEVYSKVQTEEELDSDADFLSAIINGKQAEALVGKTEEEIVQILLTELDELYDGQASH